MTWVGQIVIGLSPSDLLDGVFESDCPLHSQSFTCSLHMSIVRMASFTFLKSDEFILLNNEIVR